MDFASRLPDYLVPFFSISSPTDAPANPDSFPNSRYYKTDPKDFCLVITFIAIMAILRDALRLGVFEPFVKWKLSRDLRLKRKQQNGTTRVVSNGNGHSHTAFTKAERRKMRHSVFRFAEQGWPIVYYPLQWAFGLYIHNNLPTKLLDPVDVWANYPHIPLAAPIKIYYLSQLAFYVHQVLILNAEARRKDHYQMMTHHVITIFLVWGSYYYNLTRNGCLIMMLMDLCDIFLPLAKMLRYLELPQIFPDITFGAFMVSWFITRHVLFIIAIKSAFLDMPRVTNFGWDPSRGYYLTKGSHYMFIMCLLALEVLQIIWFGMICRVAWRVISGESASDVRSDEEGENDDTDDIDKEE
ncbi:longevity assurance proteins LAG1/LAC1 [Gymnopus androsaceus JB14]|uniref:Longevity assurance proteins LAG1/LAC1 n=1 Tax=Gymnopus androsaceus JB14 TaxID=1447944 RepID=A0A6A4IQP8_9AGAR|nr:longevity assurance proteins LAG1/LAC1 [Gymnopus androsaceus JB14]